MSAENNYSTDSIKISDNGIVHQTVDGQVVVISLVSGNYFAMNTTGSIIWNAIVKNPSMDEITTMLASACSEFPNNQLPQNIEEEVVSFVQTLVANDLVERFQTDERNEIDTTSTETLNNAKLAYETPTINIYSDLQELLLSDPIHDVEEGGWPNLKREES